MNDTSPKSTTILFEPSERELIIKAKKMLETSIKRTTNTEVTIPMRSVVMRAIKTMLMEMEKK